MHKKFKSLVSLFLAFTILLGSLNLPSLVYADDEESTETKNIVISTKVENDIGKDQVVKEDYDKEYINAVVTGDVGIKDALDLKIENLISKDKFEYTFNAIDIVTEDGAKRVTKEEYDKNEIIENIESLKDTKVFEDVLEIQLVYTGNYKPLKQTISVNINGIDELHKEKDQKKYTSFSLNYKGELSESSYDITSTIKDNKVQFKIIPKGDVTVNGEDTREVSFNGYNIKNNSVVNKGSTEFTENFELTLQPNVSTLGTLKFGNKFNNFFGVSNHFKYDGSVLKYGHIKDGEDNYKDVNSLFTIENTNRKSGVSGYKTNEIYHNDTSKVTIKKENLDTFVKTVYGDKFEFADYDAYGEKQLKDKEMNYTAGNSYVVYEIFMDFNRIKYNVKVNDEEIVTYDIMADSDYIIFDMENIESVNINGSGENLKGSKIDISKLSDTDIINIKTVGNGKIEEGKYHIQNEEYGTKTKLNERRTFKGLVGMKVLVRPITENEYEVGDDITISDKAGYQYKLTDVKEKEITVKKDLVTPFYFIKNDRVRYKVMHIAKYGENWDNDLENSDYDIINMKDDKDNPYKLHILYQSDILITDKNSNPNIKPGDYQKDNFNLIDIDPNMENRVVEGKDIEKLGIPETEGFARVEFVSGPISEVNKDTLYIYSYAEEYIKKEHSTIEIPTKIEFENEDDHHLNADDILEIPRLKEDYEINMPIPKEHSCYKDTVVDAEYLKGLDGVSNLEYDKDNIKFTVEKIDENNIKDLFPKLPKIKDETEKPEVEGKSGIKRFSLFSPFNADEVEEVEDETLDHLSIKYTNKSDSCVPKEYSFFVKMNIQNSYIDNDQIVDISGEDNIQKVTVIRGTDIRLDFNLDDSGNKVVDSEQTIYKFKPFNADDNYTALVDAEGNRITLDESGDIVSENSQKTFGVDTDTISSKKLEKEQTYYLMYEPTEKPKEDTESYDFSNKYYYLEIPQNLEIVFGKTEEDKTKEIEEFYEDFNKLVTKYYNWDNRVSDFNKILDDYYNANKSENSEEVRKTLETIKTNLKDNHVPKVKEIIPKIDEIINGLDENPEAGKNNIDENIITSEELKAKSKELNQNIKEYTNINSEGKFILKDYANDKHNKKDAEDTIIKWMDNSLGTKVYNTSSTVKETFNENYEYVGNKYTQYSKMPLYISAQTNEKEPIFTDFKNIKDINSEAGLDKLDSWKNYKISEDEFIDYSTKESNIQFSENPSEIPVIYAQRQYKKLELKKIDKPVIPNPDENNRNLDVIFRRVEIDKDNNINVLETMKELHYKNLPEYFTRLGWTILDYKSKDLEYVDDSGQTPKLKEGDVKYSPKLENNKTQTLYIDYKGEGELPEIEEVDYFVIYRERIFDNDQIKYESLKIDEDFDGKGMLGQIVNIKPLNLEHRGYKLLDKDGNITDNYDDISKTISKDKDVFYVDYQRVDSIDYDIEYINTKGESISDKQEKLIIKDKTGFTENAKQIDNYKVLKDIGNFNLVKEEDDRKLEFRPELGYKIENIDENTQAMYKNNVKVMELEKQGDKYIIRFIYEDIINLTLNANGGQFDDNELIKTSEILKNIVIDPTSLDKPARGDHKFIGWYEKDTEGNLLDKPFDFSKSITDNLTLYAKWEEKGTIILANGEKYTDVLTATVLGNELKAPILLTRVNDMTVETIGEINRINPKKIIISGGVDSVSQKIVNELIAKGYNVERLAGNDRYATAREIGKEVRTITGVLDKAMLVDGTNFPDVITISTLASKNRTPILLTQPKTLNKTTDEVLKDFNIKNITIGGEIESVSNDIEKFLKTDYTVSRIGGVDRYETASLIAKEVRSLTGNNNDLILVDGTDFPDGITINSIAGKQGSPILLTQPNLLNETAKKDIEDFNIKNILIGGGVNSVSENIEKYLRDEKLTVNRVHGKDRYETAVRISELFTEK